jgi:hypothetical protein
MLAPDRNVRVSNSLEMSVHSRRAVEMCEIAVLLRFPRAVRKRGKRLLCFPRFPAERHFHRFRGHDIRCLMSLEDSQWNQKANRIAAIRSSTFTLNAMDSCFDKPRNPTFSVAVLAALGKHVVTKTFDSQRRSSKALYRLHSCFVSSAAIPAKMDSP